MIKIKEQIIGGKMRRTVSAKELYKIAHGFRMAGVQRQAADGSHGAHGLPR